MVTLPYFVKKEKKSVTFQRRNNVEIKTRFTSLYLPPFRGRESFCVPMFHWTKSVTTNWREFRTKFGNDPPTGNSITKRYEKFENTGCFCKGNTSGLLSTNEKTIDHNRQTYLRSPKECNTSGQLRVECTTTRRAKNSSKIRQQTLLMLWVL
jgi:hypothetical protein